jgi:DNA-binding FadR family transcriptional regulator
MFRDMPRSDSDDKALDWAQPPEPSGRIRAADHVFEALAGAILNGKLAPNAPLPPERELAARFDISRVLVREAIHKLKDLGLVRVRQGGQTIVLDPDMATDPRVTVLLFELASPFGSAIREMAERELIHGVVLLILAEARAVTSEIDELDKIVDDYVAAGADAAPLFLMQFWIAVGAATKNSILHRETRYWFALAARRSDGVPPAMLWDHEQRISVHREVVERLRRRAGAAEYFMGVIRQSL